MVQIVGWDIGGANVKAAWLELEHGRIRLGTDRFATFRNLA